MRQRGVVRPHRLKPCSPIGVRRHLDFASIEFHTFILQSIEYDTSMADFETGLLHLAQSLKAMRQERGYSQSTLAELAGVPRLKVVQIEAGKPGVAVAAYARVAAAMGGEMRVVPQQRPTLDEIRELLRDDLA